MKLITGANGFIGKALSKKLTNHNIPTILTSHHQINENQTNQSVFPCSIDGLTDWSDIFKKKVDTVIHLAARAHILKDTLSNPLDGFRKVNLEGTLNLAQQAAAAQVKRFIFLSTIGVNGSCTDCSPFTVFDTPNPHNPYSLSKFEAEQGLHSLSKTTDMEIVIIRVPLVYGPHFKGNLATLNKILNWHVPLPLLGIQNKRSFISLHNLVDLIMVCINHPKAANKTFLASDDHDLSTEQFIKKFSFALNKPAILFHGSPKFFVYSLQLIGKENLARQLFASLQVDISETKKIIGWSPPLTVEQSMKEL